LGFARVDQLRKLAEQREQEAIDEKAKAEASQRQAMDVLRATTEDVIEQLIGAKPQLGPAEKAFLENTLKRWQIFATEQGEGEQARAIRAEGTGRVADLWEKLGQHDTALGGCKEAITLFKYLVADFPAVHYYRRELAASHNNLGLVLANVGRRPEAEDAYRQALAIQGNLVADFPDVPLYRHDLAKHHSNLGRVLGDLGQRPKAQRAYQEALTILDKLVTDFPAVAKYRQTLVSTYISLGELYSNDLGRRPEAEAAYQKALKIHETLAAEFSTQPNYRQQLAGVHNNLGLLLGDMGRRLEAEAASREALTIQEKLATDFPAVPKYRIDLAGSQVNFGIVLRKNKQPEQSLEWYGKAIATLDVVMRQVKSDVTAQGNLCNAHWGRADAFLDLKRFSEAEAAHRQVLAIREKLVAEFPAIADYRIDLGGSQCNFGIMLRSSMQPERAVEWYSKAIATLDDVLMQVRTDVRAREFLGNAYLDRALAYDDLERHAEAAADFDKAMDLKPEPRRPAIRVRRALSLVRAGQVDLAIQEAEELTKNANANSLYNAACLYALAIAAPQPNAVPQEIREKYAQRAVALLQQAVTNGWKDTEHMKKDDDLKSLREREDFMKLLAEMEAGRTKTR
jgi:tetratricopeptide (TPR) repeat protein